MLKNSCAAILVLLFAGCNARIDGSITQSGRADLHISSSIMQQMAKRLNSFAASNGADSNAPLIDAKELTKALAAVKGIEKADFVNKSNNTIDGRLAVQDIRKIIPAQHNFISWEEKSDGVRIRIMLNRENGHVLLKQLSQDISDYISSLMAPLATGEELTKEEYLELVSSVWGADIAKEISNGVFTVQLSFPKAAVNVRGGNLVNGAAKFDIPLLDILVLENPLEYEVRW